jgi:hypothetical protein
MDRHDAALVAAGLIGGAGAIVHGILTERLIVRPFQERAATHIPRSTRRLLAMLLHFSAFNWLVGGLVLLVAANTFEREARLVTGLLVGSSYLFAAVGNLWATRGRHPGWVLYGAAVLLIVYGLGKAAV